MKKIFPPFLCLIFIVTACAKAVPTALPLSPSVTLELSTSTPLPQPSETIILTPTLSVVSPISTFDIGSSATGKDGMMLLYVPAGKFTMGNDNNGDDVKPAHLVYLDAFWIDQTEVTNEQYAMCISNGGCTHLSSTKSPTRSNYYGNPEFYNYPVIYVDWKQANAYCAWVGRQLPTEAQWEKAARGADGRVYPWGNTAPNDSLLNYNSAVRDTTEVGKYPDGKSPYGVYDMAGNVWEWVSDWYGGNYYQSSPSSNPLGPNDPSGSVEQAGYAQVLRGGSWYYEEGSLRSIFRYGVVPVDFLVRSDTRSWAIPKYEDTSVYGRPPLGFGTVGFRCALNATP
ncbi:MAG: formylglycine-generating enzyme family protein [Chloroflexota bacterium]